jgi:aminoglycoside phosphotransferase (APT) family kinase protein
MAAKRMHPDEVDIDEAMVARLLAEQHPRWARLPLEEVPSAGTVNAIYRLGDGLSVRLPRVPGGAEDVEREYAWLSRLGPRLPLATPVPRAKGEPSADYPYPWMVCRWVDGAHVPVDALDDPERAARDLAGFVATFRAFDPTGAPRGARDGHLVDEDPHVRKAIAASDDLIDTAAVRQAWQRALDAPAWDGEPVWAHGDLLPGNLLAADGRLSAVIDFGCMGLADPAFDVIVAWTYLDAATRDVFRSELGVDDAVWERARGWVLRIGLLALPYYVETNPGFAATARRMVEEVLADPDR